MRWRSATNSAAPTIDQTIGNGWPPTLRTSGSDKWSCSATHGPKSAPMKPSAVEATSPPGPPPTSAFPTAPQIAAMTTNTSSAGSVIVMYHPPFLTRCRFLRFVVRRTLLEDPDKVAARFRDADAISHDDRSCRQFAPIDLLTRVVVRTKRGALERHAREQTTRTRVAEDLGSQRHVRGGLGVPPFGSGGGRHVGAQLDLAAEQRFRAAVVHDEEDDVGRFASELQAEAAALE